MADGRATRNPRRRLRFGPVGLAMLAWTVGFTVWFAPTGLQWWNDACDVIAFRATGGPPWPRRTEAFLADLPFKIGCALAILLAGYGALAALAGLSAIARDHADALLGRPRELSPRRRSR